MAGRFRRVFRLPMRRERLSEVLDDELRFHVEERVRDLEAHGMSRADAEREARRRFGDYESYRTLTQLIDETTMRNRSRMELWGTIRREVSHAARVLGRTRAFSLIAFITLAVGIGATTAIFTVLDAVILRPLPYPSAEQLVSVMHPTAAPGSGERKWGLSSVGYFHFREHTRAFADLGAYRSFSVSVSIPGQDALEARVGQVSASLFTTLQARAAVGRLILPDDDRPRAPRVIVLSHEFWRRQFGEDPSVVGRSIETAVGSRQVVGVAEPGLTLPRPGPFASTADLAGFGVDYWEPLQLNPATRQNNHAFAGVARLKPGFTAQDADREVAAITQRFPELYPDVYSKRFMESYNFRGAVLPLRDEVLGPTLQKALWILFGAVALVLVIACANVTNLFLVRMEARRRESAIRGALGADRRHMAVHFLAESLMLTLSAGAAAVLLAHIGIRAILAVAPRSIPRLTEASIGWSSVAFAATLAVLAGLLFGLIPLLRARVDVQTLRESSRGLTPSGRQRAVRNVLVVGQVALAFMLLASAGLMVRSFMQLRDVRPGLDPRNVLTLGVSLSYRRYDSMEKAAAFYREFSRRVEALPGVTAAGGSGGLPLRDYGNGCSVVFRENQPYAPGEPTPCVSTPHATPGFFAALGIPVRGRAPDWSDVDRQTQAVVVTAALADRLWPGEDPIGRGINSNGTNSTTWYRVTGVIPELRAHGLDQPPSEAVFYAANPLFPAMSTWGNLNELEFVIRTGGTDPLMLVPAVRKVLTEMDPTIPLNNPSTMQGVVDRSMARTSFVMLLLAMAAGMALLLSAVGIYGVISYLVAQRRAEIGVRIALGAPVRWVVALVMGQSVRLALAGVVIGLAGALAGTRLLQSLLFGVSATDPAVLVVVPVLLLSIAALASFAPARRAARVDPVEALRG